MVALVFMSNINFFPDNVRCLTVTCSSSPSFLLVFYKFYVYLYPILHPNNSYIYTWLPGALLGPSLKKLENPTPKNVLLLQETNLSSSKIIFQKTTCKAWKTKKKSALKKFLLWRFYNLYSSKAQRNSSWSKSIARRYNIINASWKGTLSKQLFIPLSRTSDENTKNNIRHKRSCWALVIFCSKVINFEHLAQITKQQFCSSNWSKSKNWLVQSLNIIRLNE